MGIADFVEVVEKTVEVWAQVVNSRLLRGNPMTSLEKTGGSLTLPPVKLRLSSSACPYSINERDGGKPKVYLGTKKAGGSSQLPPGVMENVTT
jgi:hypothetical protein